MLQFGHDRGGFTWRRGAAAGVPPMLVMVVFAVVLMADWMEAAGYGDQLQVNPDDDGMVDVVGANGTTYHLRTWRPEPKPNNWVPYGVAVGVGLVIAGVGSAVAYRMAGASADQHAPTRGSGADASDRWSRRPLQ